MAISIYRYLIKYKAKRKRLLPFFVTDNELKKFCINDIIKMESKDEFKKINIKNRTCYHFDDIIEMLIIVIFYWTKKYVKKITKIFNL